MKFAAFQNPAVFELLNRLFVAQVPVKVAYKLSKIQKAVTVESERYQELRMKIVTKHGSKDEAGELIVDEAGNAKLEDGVIEALVEEMRELHDIEVALDNKIKLDDLEKVELSATDLSILEMLDILEE
ncbi:hypothetical protein [Xanthomonas phage BUDD]|nr:hypothetical protein [Xanthomonas phage BUDD]